MGGKMPQRIRPLSRSRRNYCYVPLPLVRNRMILMHKEMKHIRLWTHVTTSENAKSNGFIGVEYEGSGLAEVDGIFATKTSCLKSKKHV